MIKKVKLTGKEFGLKLHLRDLVEVSGEVPHVVHAIGGSADDIIASRVTYSSRSLESKQIRLLIRTGTVTAAAGL